MVWNYTPITVSTVAVNQVCVHIICTKYSPDVILTATDVSWWRRIMAMPFALFSGAHAMSLFCSHVTVIVWTWSVITHTATFYTPSHADFTLCLVCRLTVISSVDCVFAGHLNGTQWYWRLWFPTCSAIYICLALPGAFFLVLKEEI